jgi:hypothetical protein
MVLDLVAIEHSAAAHFPGDTLFVTQNGRLTNIYVTERGLPA